MKRTALGAAALSLALVVAFRSHRLAFEGIRALGAGVTVAREAHLLVVRVPRGTGVRLRAVLADETRPRLLPLEDIAAHALAAVNGDYHELSGPRFARPYSLLVTDGRVACPAPTAESFWLDEEHVPHVGTPRDAWLAIGTGPRLLEAGEVTERIRTEKTQPGWVSRLARTAVGFDEKTVFLVATAQVPFAGLSMEELARAMKSLGCREALNLDGGPSTTLVGRGELLNVPPGDEGLVNPVATALLVLEPDGSAGVR